MGRYGSDDVGLFLLSHIPISACDRQIESSANEWDLALPCAGDDSAVGMVRDVLTQSLCRIPCIGICLTLELRLLADNLGRKRHPETGSGTCRVYTWPSFCLRSLFFMMEGMELL